MGKVCFGMERVTCFNLEIEPVLTFYEPVQNQTLASEPVQIQFKTDVQPVNWFFHVTSPKTS